MKLYIPTCTLNFNNIFSTESISPASFYAKRGFGNKRFYRVEANDLDNVILLYTTYPHYKVEDGDMENAPLVIEIESEDYKESQFVLVNKKGDVSVYASKSTIYLNPFRCKVYFDSYQSLQSTLTKAEQSLENKYSKLYQANFLVRQEKSWSITNLFSAKDYFDWNSSYNADADKIIPGDYNEDVIIDRIKGCLICYLIGANMSISKETSRLKQLSRRMRNTLSAIVNSPNRRPTDLQDETLTKYIQEFNEIYAKVDENTLHNNKLIISRLVSPSTGLDADTLLKVLKDLHLEKPFYETINMLPTYNAFDLYNCLNGDVVSTIDSYNNEIGKLFDAIKRIETRELEQNKKKDIEQLIKVSGNTPEVIDERVGKGKFYTVLLKSLIDGEYKNFMQEKGTDEALSIAFVGGAKLKGFMEDKWDGSKFQTYINGLLMNIQKGDAFDIFSIDNEILQSFAAFCQKGEEIDRLTDYMVQSGFSEYRFALGLYGATRGFASLPKTFTSTLINAAKGHKEYYADFYVKMHKQLFNINLPNPVIQSDNSCTSSSLSGIIPSTLVDNIDKIEPKRNRQGKIVEAISQTAALEDAVQSPKAFMYILDSFPNITRTKAYKNLVNANFAEDSGVYTPEEFRDRIYDIIGSKDLKAQKEKIDIAIDLEAKRQDSQAFLYILDNFLDKSSSAYKRIAEIVRTKMSEHSSNRAEAQMGFQIGATPSHMNTSGSLFITDKNCGEIIKRFVPEKYFNDFIRDLIWFQDEYAKGDKSQYYAKANRENNATIDAFSRYISRKKYGPYIKIQEMTSFLHQIYL